MRFHQQVHRFRDALHTESANSPAPGIAGLLERERYSRNLRLVWAAAAAAMIVLCATTFPTSPTSEPEDSQADARLLQDIQASLARPVPRAMEPLCRPDPPTEKQK